MNPPPVQGCLLAGIMPQTAAPLSAAAITTLAPSLIERWSRLLPLQRGESLLLALDLWARVAPRLTARELAACGAPRPFETALAGCLWVAAKMEECRRGLPNATKVPASSQTRDDPQGTVTASTPSALCQATSGPA